jgi:hypothetical protein
VKKAVDYAVSNTCPKPEGFCARYSTAAISVGFGVEEQKVTPLLSTRGASTSYLQFTCDRLAIHRISAPDSAKDYGTSVLRFIGFYAVGNLPADDSRAEIQMPSSYAPQAGDVAIFQPNPLAGDSDGHMQICTGDFEPKKLWVSDGHQNTFLPNSDLENKGWQKVSYTIYRFSFANLLFQPIVAR